MTSRSFNTNYTSGVTPGGLWRAEVVAVDGNLISIKIPRLGMNNIYEKVQYVGFTPAVGDRVWAGFIENNSANPVVFSGGADHGVLSGLDDDDHPQYLLADGTRDAAYIGFDTELGHPVSEGQIAWNDDEGTVDIGMHGGNVVLQSGQEVLYYVKNQTGSTITNGTVVRFDGSLGSSGRIKVAPFLGDKTYKSAYIMGIATEDIANGEDGYVTHFGKVRGLDTTEDSEGNALVDGDLLYASATVLGGYTKIEPAAPNNRVLLAAVVQAHAHQGTLFVRPTFVADLLDNERVNAPSVANNDILVYNSVSGVFENKSFDHGLISGLSDDDHPQYLTVDRGDLRYYTETEADARFAAIDLSPTITLSDGASGSVTLTNLASGTLSVTIADDSHTHDTRYFTETEADSRFIIKDTDYEWTSGQLSFTSSEVLETSAPDLATLEVYQPTAGADAFMQFNVSNSLGGYFGLKGDIYDFAVGGWSGGTNSYRVWHEGNDGIGLGLDADLLNGLAPSAGNSPPSGREVLTTHTNGYTYVGWLNTVSGATTSTISRIYASNDQLLRYVTPDEFRDQIANKISFCTTPSRFYDATASGTVNHTLGTTVGGVSVSGAIGVFMTVTVVPSTNGGFVDIQPYGTSNVGSTVNFEASGETKNGFGFVRLDTSRRFTSYRSNSARVILDIRGFVF